jgi:hypothetical protein
MRAFAAIVAALSTPVFMLAAAAPAQAIGLPYCDNMKNDQDRMACLQQHISHLEETLLALSGRISALETALDKKLSAEVIYKLQSVENGGCIGLEGDPQRPGLVGCDHPDAWKMLAGPQIKKPEKPASPSEPKPEAEAKPATPPSPAGAGQAGKPANPCRNLSEMACAAKPDVCEWKADKNRCGKK